MMSREDFPVAQDPADRQRLEQRKRLFHLLTPASDHRFALRLKSFLIAITATAVIWSYDSSHAARAQAPTNTPTATSAQVFAAAQSPVGTQPSRVSQSPPPSVAWKTGPDLRLALDSPVGVTWSGSPLRPSVQRLAREFRVAMWLDRRLDPGQSIELSIANEPLDVGCQRLAAKLNAGLSRVGPVVYYGPTFTAERLATVAAMRRADIERLPAAERTRLAATRNMRWDDLAEPRTLVRSTIAEVGLEVPNLERAMPHDLWPAAELPPMVWSDRLSLLLAGFDLTFAVDLAQRRVELQPLPESPRVEKVLAVKGNAAQVAADWADKFPQADVRVAGGKLAIRARYEDLEVMERVARGERVERARVVAGPSEFTLTVENQPAGAIIRHIAKQLKLTLEVAPDAVEPLEKLVSVKAERLRLEDLLTAVLRDTGLRCDREEDRLRVRRQ
jgi:hypothetical protein